MRFSPIDYVPRLGFGDVNFTPSGGQVDYAAIAAS